MLIALTGPIDKLLFVPAGAKVSFEIPAGRYKVAAELLAPEFSPFFAVQEYTLGHEYKSDLSFNRSPDIWETTHRREHLPVAAVQPTASRSVRGHAT